MTLHLHTHRQLKAGGPSPRPAPRLVTAWGLDLKTSLTSFASPESGPWSQNMALLGTTVTSWGHCSSAEGRRYPINAAAGRNGSPLPPRAKTPQPPASSPGCVNTAQAPQACRPGREGSRRGSYRAPGALLKTTAGAGRGPQRFPQPTSHIQPRTKSSSLKKDAKVWLLSQTLILLGTESGRMHLLNYAVRRALLTGVRSGLRWPMGTKPPPPKAPVGQGAM